MEEKIKCRKEGFKLMLKESLNKLTKTEDISTLFKEYFLIESKYISIIKETQLINQVSKYLIYTYLNDYYYISSNNNIIISRINF